MLLTAALALGVFGNALHAPRLPDLLGGRGPMQASVRHARVGAWSIAARSDPFAGTVACAMTARGVGLQRQTLIFRVAPRGDTTQAVYRVDSAPPHPISDTFDAVQAHGFFPQKGWIVDPDGGEAALPVATVGAAHYVWIRVTPRRNPVRFNVGGLPEALAAAKRLGCSV
jgi:hypothetical protein